MTDEFGKGFSLTNLKLMRKFYLTYRSEIGQTVSGFLPEQQKGQTVSDHLPQSENRLSPLTFPGITEAISSRFCLSWSHYVFLTGIKNPEERRFYEIGAARQGWSLRELKRHVYVYEPPRPLVDIEWDIKQLTEEIVELLGVVTE